MSSGPAVPRRRLVGKQPVPKKPKTDRQLTATIRVGATGEPLGDFLIHESEGVDHLHEQIAAQLECGTSPWRLKLAYEDAVLGLRTKLYEYNLADTPTLDLFRLPCNEYVLAPELPACPSTEVHILGAETGQYVRSFGGHKGIVLAAAFSRDGRLLATASYDLTTKLWDVESGECLHVLKGHRGIVRSVAFFPDATKVLTASNDTSIKVWSTTTGKALFTFASDTFERILSAQISMDGTTIVVSLLDDADFDNIEMYAFTEQGIGTLRYAGGRGRLVCDPLGSLHFGYTRSTWVSKRLVFCTASSGTVRETLIGDLPDALAIGGLSKIHAGVFAVGTGLGMIAMGSLDALFVAANIQEGASEDRHVWRQLSSGSLDSVDSCFSLDGRFLYLLGPASLSQVCTATGKVSSSRGPTADKLTDRHCHCGEFACSRLRMLLSRDGARAVTSCDHCVAVWDTGSLRKVWQSRFGPRRRFPAFFSP
eukprot:TRINITY_DN19234_c0_g1_i1.p1 TRINITY_DN19234_c0_g1~~TRINITY_DN19234_c0_g1_i1.p1  ORF type:complete len:480 (-),score=31.20 TRINITY_DN19234_c0_g1_i1:154-1593(-)